MNRALKKTRQEPFEFDPNISEEVNYSNFENNFKKRNDSLIQDLFYGCFKSQTVCPSCYYQAASYEPFNMLSLSITPQNYQKDELNIYMINEEDLFEALKVTIVFRELDTLEDVRRTTCKAFYKDVKSMQFYIFNLTTNQFSVCSKQMNDTLKSLNLSYHELLLLITDKPPLEEYEECVRVWFDLRFDGWKSNKNDQLLLPFKIFYFPKKVKVETLYSMVYRWLYKSFYFRSDDFYRRFSRGMNGFEQENRPFDLIIKKTVVEFDALSRESEEVELEQEQIIIQINDLSSMSHVDLFAMSIREYRDPVVMNHMNIASCFDNLTAEYSLDEQNRWKCSKCSLYEKAMVNLSLKKLPEILIIHFKRFKQMEDHTFDKVTLDIQFPQRNLDLAKYVDTPIAGENTCFDLFAMINHRGSLQRGHYVALIHHFIEQKWYKFDDDIVSEASDPWSSNSDQPYILFYKKKNTK